jgi:hypothetical protein
VPTGLGSFDVLDVRRSSDVIRRLGEDASSMEEAAQRIVQYLHQELEGAVLVRLYKTHPFGKLPRDLQEYVGEPVEPDVRCLTLLGTAGDLPDWNDRRRSRGHQAIPLPSEHVVEQLPMVLQLITQLGLDVTTVLRPDPDAARALSQRTYDVFHVPDAVASPYVPAKDFVQDHSVRSALGFGGMLYTGDFYAVVLFSREFISAETARMIKILSLPVRVPLLAHLRRVFT